MMNKAQADVVYGFVGVRRSDPDYTAISVMNNALGQYAIGGRLGDSIRERQGMAYYVFSSLDATFGPGPFTIRAGVSAANVEKTIASIDQELDRAAQQGFHAAGDRRVEELHDRLDCRGSSRPTRRSPRFSSTSRPSASAWITTSGCRA